METKKIVNIMRKVRDVQNVQKVQNGRRGKKLRANKMNTEVSSSEARENFSKYLDKSVFHGERTVIKRRGRKAAIVPIEDVEILERLEEKMDIADGRRAIAEANRKGTSSWRKLKAELKLK